MIPEVKPPDFTASSLRILFVDAIVVVEIDEVHVKVSYLIEKYKRSLNMNSSEGAQCMSQGLAQFGLTFEFGKVRNKGSCEIRVFLF